MSDPRNPEVQHSLPESRMPPMPRVIPSAELLNGAREILIQHGQEIYRLRVTKAGKLILNK